MFNPTSIDSGEVEILSWVNNKRAAHRWPVARQATAGAGHPRCQSAKELETSKKGRGIETIMSYPIDREIVYL